MAGTIVLTAVDGGKPSRSRASREPFVPPGVASPVSRRLLRVKDAAHYLNVSHWKVRQLLQSGKVPYFQDGEGSLILLDIHDLDQFIERNKSRELGRS